MKKLCTIIMFILIITMITGCRNAPDETQLNSYHDDKILSEYPDWAYFDALYGYSADNKDHTEYGNFYGSETEYYIYSEGEGTFNIEFQSAVTKGEFKYVLITPDKRVIPLFEGNAEGMKEIDIVPGKSILAYAGYGATGRFITKITALTPMTIRTDNNPIID